MKTLKIVNGDWVIDTQTGRPVTVSGHDKLVQDIRECLTIATQANGFGAGLDELLGTVADSFGLRLGVDQRIRAAMANMQRLQARSQSQRTLDERLANIDQLVVSNASPSGYQFTLRVRSFANRTVTTTGGGG